MKNVIIKYLGGALVLVILLTVPSLPTLAESQLPPLPAPAPAKPAPVKVVVKPASAKKPAAKPAVKKAPAKKKPAAKKKKVNLNPPLIDPANPPSSPKKK